MSDSKKTLLPELLPSPSPESASDPRERVHERARELLKRFREMGVTGVAILSLQCGDGRLDASPRREPPIDPPLAGSGAAGTGGSTGVEGGRFDARPVGVDSSGSGSGAGGAGGGGYGVVDPIPPPAYFQCTAAANPFATLKVSATVAQPGQVYLYLSAGVLGLRVDTVRVTGGTLISVDDRNASSRYNPYLVVTLAPTIQPSVLVVEVDLGCGDAKTTKRYQITYDAAVAGTNLPVEEPRAR